MSEIEPDLAALAPHETLEQLRDYYFPPYISLAHIFNAPRVWGYQNRILKQYCLDYVLEGKAEFTVANQTFLATKGDLIFHRPYEVHSIVKFPETDYVSISIVFHFSGFPFPLEQILQHESYVGNFENQQVEHYISELVAKYHQQGLYNHMICQGLLMLILSESSKWKKDHKSDSGHQQKNLARLVLIKKYIGDNYQQNINPAELEQMFGFTWNYIISQFNLTFGMTPVQYLTHKRIAKAKELALQSNLSFSEIANYVGYTDIHSFGKMFKKKTGMSLTDFCASVLANNPYD